jgi:hypothetical protein
MSLANSIAQMGVRAERQLDKVLDKTESLNEQLEGLSELEDQLDAATADGILDAGELADLAAQARGVSPELAAQLHKAAAGGPLSGEALEKLADRVSAAVKRGRRDLSDSESMLAFERNVLVADIQTHYTHASNVMKAEHETYMNIIANMKA